MDRRPDEAVLGAQSFGGDTARWGTLLDNLHVCGERQRQGVGRALMARIAAWCATAFPDCGLQLWVLAHNAGARRFYECLGAPLPTWVV